MSLFAPLRTSLFERYGHPDNWLNYNRYLYCYGNPLIYTDPSGNEIWTINSNGEVVSKTTNTDVDRFEFLNADGTTSSVQFNYGVVESTRSQKVMGQSMDVYMIRGDENAKNLFEFLVDGTNNNSIEWSWFATGIEGDKGLNFISTSHEKGKDSSATELFENQLSNGYTIRSHTHNHPSGNNNNSISDNRFYNYVNNRTKYNHDYFGGTSKNPNYRIYTTPNGYCNVNNKDLCN